MLDKKAFVQDMLTPIENDLKDRLFKYAEKAGDKARKLKKENLFSEGAGLMTGKFIGRGLGYGAGSLIGGRDEAKIGELLGALSPLTIALVAAAASPTRSVKEQAEHDAKKATLSNLAIPGMAAYQLSKRLGSYLANK